MTSKRTAYVIAVLLILSAAVNIMQFTQSSNPLSLSFNSGSNQTVSYELQSSYNELYNQYGTLYSEYQTLSQEYAQFKQVALTPPYVSISKGTITWVFTDVKGDTITWQLPMDTYIHYASMQKPVQVLSLQTTSGTVTTDDVRPYIQPSFFANSISSLTEGRSDKEFVKEVDNIKNELVIYGTSLGEAPYQFPAETLTEGTGKCADTTILMASMLIAGDREANYNFNVYVEYVQLNPDGTLVSNSNLLTDPNHAIIKVVFADGTVWSIETTTNYFYTYSQAYIGWQFDVTSVNA
ncbi:MAG: hypothetical protein ABSD99_00345 [Candidatus Bathyarchaeia archaeon]